MFFFNRKSKTSCEDLLKEFVPRFSRSTVALFESEKEIRGDRSWIVKSTKELCRTDPLEEWVLYMLAGYIHGCDASTKDDESYLRFKLKFMEEVGRDFVKRGIFSSDSEFNSLARDRVSHYLEAISEGEESMHEVARIFLRNVGCNADDIALHIGAVGFFMNQTITTKKLFDELQKITQLVA